MLRRRNYLRPRGTGVLRCKHRFNLDKRTLSAKPTGQYTDDHGNDVDTKRDWTIWSKQRFDYGQKQKRSFSTSRRCFWRPLFIRFRRPEFLRMDQMDRLVWLFGRVRRGVPNQKKRIFNEIRKLHRLPRSRARRRCFRSNERVLLARRLWTKTYFWRNHGPKLCFERGFDDG